MQLRFPHTYPILAVYEDLLMEEFHMATRSTYEEALVKRIRELEKETERWKKAEGTLRKSEQRLSEIVLGSSIPTFVIDQNHVLTHCNRAFENLTGISAKEIIGTTKQWLPFYTTKRPVLADLILSGASDGKISEYYGLKCEKSAIVEGGYEAEAFFSDNWKEGKWLFITASLLKDTEDQIIGAIETLQDITRQKRTEEALRRSERRYRKLLEFLPSPVVLFTMNGKVSYFNSAFTDTFGWTLKELEGKTIPYVPRDLEEDTAEDIKQLFQDKILLHRESKRTTKDNRTLDVAIKATIYSEADEGPACELVLLRDITMEKMNARNNEAILRISRALPEYPDLEELLDYINGEVKQLLNAEGAAVILRDEEKNDLFVLGAVYDTEDMEYRVKESRFPINQLLAGRVLSSGEPLVLNQISEDLALHSERDRKLGYSTRNLLLVPLKSFDRIIGVLSAINKKQGDFEPGDTDLLSMIAGTVVLSIENARFSEEIKEAYRNNEALLRISTALPEYPDLEELLDYISNEVKRLTTSEGALVVLRDEEKDELFFLGVAYDDNDTQNRVKEIRFSMDQLVAGRVIRTGRPIIVNDTSDEPNLHIERDKKLGYQTRNLILVPLKSFDRIIGVLCAINKKQGDFEPGDIDLLSMIAGTVVLSIENARFSEEIKKAYRGVSALNRAKDKVINHLSHELKTPISILATNLKILENRLSCLPEETWKRAMERSKRNLDRILEIQYKAHDILQDKQYKIHGLISSLLDQCADQLESLLEDQIGDNPVIGRIRERIDEVFGTDELIPEKIHLPDFLNEKLQNLICRFTHREVEVLIHIDPVMPLYLPPEVLEKIIDGLIRNAIENTPDQGKIELKIHEEQGGAIFTVHDYGVGITEESQKRIFEGFFSTQDTLDYSTKKPFDFNAGGKGTDLLRIKVFSERYGFQVRMISSRCRFIPKETDICPGIISRCTFCLNTADCYHSGETIFTVWFPPPVSKGEVICDPQSKGSVGLRHNVGT